MDGDICVSKINAYSAKTNQISTNKSLPKVGTDLAVGGAASTRMSKSTMKLPNTDMAVEIDKNKKILRDI